MGVGWKSCNICETGQNRTKSALVLITSCTKKRGYSFLCLTLTNLDIWKEGITWLHWSVCFPSNYRYRQIMSNSFFPDSIARL